MPRVIHQKADFAGFGLPRGVEVGSGVSEVQAAFVAMPATMGRGAATGHFPILKANMYILP
jgi:hypothetical protein